LKLVVHSLLDTKLFNATSQNLSRGLTPPTRIFQLNTLVRSDQLDAELFKLMLDLSGNIGPPSDTTYVLADDPIKSTVGSSGFIEKFLDTAASSGQCISRFS
jgi:hypothetical protein